MTKSTARAIKIKDPQILDDILTRGVEEIIPAPRLKQKLQNGEKMRIYLGVDPTGPDIHIGHAVILRKLRRLQEYGHEIIFLLGDFTARIGDPTDRTAARRVMTPTEILNNAKTYKKQAAKILDFSDNIPNPARLEFNARWLDKLKFQDVLELAAQFTVQQMLERDMYQERVRQGKPIYLHEFLYPLMQGYDSVAMSVDMEVGGNDQLFNMLVGRTLQKNIQKKEKIVMAFTLLEGLDGRKMSKSYHNIISVMDQPNEMFGKVMSLSDSLIEKYFLLCTDLSVRELKKIHSSLQAGVNPRDLKMRLGREIVTLYHSARAAQDAQQEFIKTFQQKKTPTDTAVKKIKKANVGAVDLLLETELAFSKAEARRLITQGGVRLNQQKITDIAARLNIADNDVIQVGKRKFLRLKV